MASSRHRFHPLAEEELTAAAVYYDERRPGYGLKFVRAVRALAERTAVQPQRWPLVRGRRRALLRGFPYALVYREISDEEIEIVAVAHTSRRPGYWRRR